MFTHKPFECFNAFLDQCTNDKSYIPELYKRFYLQINTCGEHILTKDVVWSYIIPDGITRNKYLEFLDFIDGNGFKVIQKEQDCYKIMPQYNDVFSLF